MSLYKAVFLDRDGVINDTVIRNGKSYPPPNLESYTFLPGVKEAVKQLKQTGYFIVVVTNQPDVGTGIQKLEVVQSMHQLIYQELQVDEIYACYHVSKDECFCRKPKPGMIFEAAKKWKIDLESSFMVGDRWSDVEAGRAAGCKTFMIGQGYQEKKTVEPHWQVSSLYEAAQIILSFN
jgi:D-glycero-D-manno-heptose 1,7-bisphosphate phosphatase